MLFVRKVYEKYVTWRTMGPTSPNKGSTLYFVLCIRDTRASCVHVFNGIRTILVCTVNTRVSRRIVTLTLKLLFGTEPLLENNCEKRNERTPSKPAIATCCGMVIVHAIPLTRATRFDYVRPSDRQNDFSLSFAIHLPFTDALTHTVCILRPTAPFLL